MLRIETSRRTDTHVRFQLFGRLAGDSVGAVDEVVDGALALGLKVVLDLGEVASVGREALPSLSSWRRRSVGIEDLPAYVEAWLEAEEGGSKPDPRTGGVLAALLLAAGTLLARNAPAETPGPAAQAAQAAAPAQAARQAPTTETIAAPATAPAVTGKLLLTRADAVRHALEEGTAARIATEKVEESAARADEAHAALMPRVGARLDQSNQSLDLETFGFSLPGQRIIPPFNVTNAQVQAALSVVDLAARARWQAARQGVAVSEATREKTENDVAAAVSSLYTALQEADALVVVHEANLELFGKLRDVAEHGRSAGTGTKLDVTRALVQLSRERQALVAAREQQEIARLSLLHATGLDQSSRVNLADELAAPPPAPAATEALAAALAARPELRAADERFAAAGLSGKAARAERLPVLSVQAQGGFSGNDIGDLKWTRGVGAFVTVPVFTGGLVGARVAEAEARRRTAETERVEARRQVEEEVRRAIFAVETARSRIALADESLALATEELESADDRWRAGVAPSIDVDHAQTNFASARQERVVAVARAARAGIELERATGAIHGLVPPRAR